MFLTVLGTSMIAGSAIGIAFNTNKSYMKRAIDRTLAAYKLDKVRIKKLEQHDYGFKAELSLPAGVTAQDFIDKTSEGLEQATFATGILCKPMYGNLVEVKFGFKKLEGIYCERMIAHGKQTPLAIPLFTPFGRKYLDFSDESTCHLLIGGATRMGKSVLLRLIMTHLYISHDGNCSLTICDNKVTDVHMFQGLPGVHIAETSGEAMMYLGDIIREGHRRKGILKAKGDCIDAKSYRAKYADKEMSPMFVIIDEYGRFAEVDEVQNMVIEIAETMGYLDIHLVIASQRPDAANVLKPRIKANLLTRIAFTTADETNSKIILDLPDAAKLGKVKGRAIFLDGFPEKVQVPYLSEEQSVELLQPYRSEFPDANPEGSFDDAAPKALPSFVEGSIGEIDLPGGQPPARNRKSNRKATSKGRMDSADTPST